MLTSNKLLTRFAIILAQIEAGKNSCKLKNQIRLIVYLLYQHNKITTKSLQQFNQVIIIMKENMIVIRSNESLAENKIKNETEHYCPHVRMETIFMNTENRKTSKPYKFVINLS